MAVMMMRFFMYTINRKIRSENSAAQWQSKTCFSGRALRCCQESSITASAGRRGYAVSKESQRRGLQPGGRTEGACTDRAAAHVLFDWMADRGASRSRQLSRGHAARISRMRCCLDRSNPEAIGCQARHGIAAPGEYIGKAAGLEPALSRRAQHISGAQAPCRYNAFVRGEPD
jgi:hypothetical protein